MWITAYTAPIIIALVIILVLVTAYIDSRDNDITE